MNRVGALVKLARQEFDGKDGAIACGELVVGHIDLGLAKDGRHAGAEKLLVDALDVVAVDDPQGLDALDAENLGQLALELLSLDVEPASDDWCNAKANQADCKAGGA